MFKREMAAIGTRDPWKYPRELELLNDLVWEAVRQGNRIRTGAAEGTDQLCAEAALEVGGYVHLSLPWDSYERAWVSTMLQRYPGMVEVEVVDPIFNYKAAESVALYHPAPGNLSQGAQKLHARNYVIIEPSRHVLALPSTKPGGGGTGQGIRIAQGLGIPVTNLLTSEGLAFAENALKGKGR